MKKEDMQLIKDIDLFKSKSKKGTKKYMDLVRFSSLANGMINDKIYTNNIDRINEIDTNLNTIRKDLGLGVK